MKKLISGAALLLAASAFLFAADLSSVLKEETVLELREKGKIQQNSFKPDDLNGKLAPVSALAEKMKSLNKIEGKPSLLGENLYLLSKSDLNGDAEKVSIKNASKILRAVSRMEGMKYYSVGEKKWTVLYKNAYCIEGPAKRVKVSDNIESDVSELVQHCFLNDNSLGKTNYKVTYFIEGDEIAVDFVNTTPVLIGPVKAVYEGNVHITLQYIDCGDDIVVYMNVKAKFPAIGLLEGRLQKSLLNRIEAIYGWFVDNFRSL